MVATKPHPIMTLHTELPLLKFLEITTKEKVSLLGSVPIQDQYEQLQESDAEDPYVWGTAKGVDCNCRINVSYFIRKSFWLRTETFLTFS